MRTPIADFVKDYANKQSSRFHMPGHKRKGLNCTIPYGIDITEVEGFDNLHDMKGVLKNTAEKLTKVYGAKKSYPLVNGSTCGVLAGLYTLTRENKNILITIENETYNISDFENIEKAVCRANHAFRCNNGCKTDLDVDVSLLDNIKSVQDAVNYCQKEVWAEEKNTEYQIRFEFSGDLFSLKKHNAQASAL